VAKKAEPAPEVDIDLTDTAVRYLTIHGYRRAYRMVGQGPALLLIHGIGDTSRSWQPLMPELGRSYTVVAPDLLGHGDSDKPRADYSVAAYANGMRDLLDVLGIDRVTVVGHSLGGGVAAQFAYQYPQRCERIVLVASGGAGREVTPFLRMAAAPLAELALPPLHWPISRFFGSLGLEFLRRIGHDLGRDATELLRVFDGLPDGSARGAFTRTLRSVVDWRGQVVTMMDRSYLVAGVPMLLVWGTHDAVIPVEHAVRAHAAMPGSRLELFDEAGHFPHHVDPERFLTLLRTFIDDTPPAQYEHERWREALRQGAPASPETVDQSPAG
jgi:pimeloyl-ACP methyl ester carboxylesterase